MVAKHASLHQLPNQIIVGIEILSVYKFGSVVGTAFYEYIIERSLFRVCHSMYII